MTSQPPLPIHVSYKCTPWWTTFPHWYPSVECWWLQGVWRRTCGMGSCAGYLPQRCSHQDLAILSPHSSVLFIGKALCAVLEGQKLVNLYLERVKPRDLGCPWSPSRWTTVNPRRDHSWSCKWCAKPTEAYIVAHLKEKRKNSGANLDIWNLQSFLFVLITLLNNHIKPGLSIFG